MTRTRHLIVPALAVTAGGVAAALFMANGSSGRDTAVRAPPLPSTSVATPTDMSAGLAPHGDPAAGTGLGLPSDSGTLPSHHMMPHELDEPVEIGSVAKAPGPLGRNVAEIHAERAQLDGKKVRVRGVVVKAVAHVLDRTFIHLRDGTGSAGDNTHDLTITAATVPRVGDELLYEGILTLDKDYGSGFRYQAVLENAKVLGE